MAVHEAATVKLSPRTAASRHHKHLNAAVEVTAAISLETSQGRDKQGHKTTVHAEQLSQQTIRQVWYIQAYFPLRKLTQYALP